MTRGTELARDLARHDGDPVRQWYVVGRALGMNPFRAAWGAVLMRRHHVMYADGHVWIQGRRDARAGVSAP